MRSGQLGRDNAARRGVVVLAALTLASACKPNQVNDIEQVDSYIARGNWSYACVATASRLDDVRTHTSRRLAATKGVTEATDCLCKAAWRPDAGTWDPAVVAGWEGTKRDDLASCLAPAASDPRVADKEALIEALAATGARAAYDAMVAVADADVSVEVAAAALRALSGSPDHDAPLIARLSHADATLRAAAASALTQRKDPATRDALLKVATSDAEGAVRAAAVASLATAPARTDGLRKLLCDLMLDDPDASVRAAAVTAFKGTTRKDEATCLKARALKQELDGEVRGALLAALAGSPRDEAADALCEAVGPWTRWYIRDGTVDKTPNADIVEAQNDRDWDRSYACVEAALKQGGLSCYGRNYLAHWFNELGGKATPPWCPGMARFVESP
jgi:hypothetical protein